MAIYTIPELSYVGETERQLQQRQVDYVTGTASYADSARGQIIGEHHGIVKLLVDRSSQQILGAHIIGEAASELIHIAQMAMAEVIIGMPASNSRIRMIVRPLWPPPSSFLA